MTTFVAIATVTILIPTARSLKDKRMVVRSTLDRVRSRFNASIAEVGSLEEHTRSELGIAVVSGSASQAREQAESVVRFIDDWVGRGGDAEVIGVEYEVL